MLATETKDDCAIMQNDVDRMDLMIAVILIR